MQKNTWRYDLSGKSLKSARVPKVLMRFELLRNVEVCVCVWCCVYVLFVVPNTMMMNL